MKQYKVLSLLQPWASLVPAGHKRIETRSWNTKYRGELLIHASVGKKAIHRSINLDFQQQFFDLNLPKYEELPFGAIIGKVNLIETFPTEKLLALKNNLYGPTRPEFRNVNSEIIWKVTEEEEAFGDYTPGRFGWLLSEPEIFETPIPAKGQLGIWNFEM